MTTERDLLADVAQVLASVDVDTSALVEDAWEEARAEVRATLKRLMARDLLARSLATLQGAPAPPVDPTSSPSTPQRASTPDTAKPTPTETTPGDGEPAPERTHRYLYGVVGPGARLPGGELPRLPGGGALRFLDGEGWRALVCDVDPTTFAALREPGPDGLDILAEAAQAHDVVLARFVEAPVLPLPLGTVLPDDEAVVDLLERHAESLRAELDRLTGVAEWAVTVHAFADPTDDAGATPAASGREYLEQRQAAHDRRTGRWGQEEQLTTSIHAPLTACAVDAVEVGSRPLEDVAPLLHGVYLLADDARSRFESTVSYLRGEHPEAVIEVSGPWPAYHFTSVELATEDESSS